MSLEEIAIHQAIMNDIAPMKITDKMIEMPCAFICGCYLLLFIVTFIAGGAGYFDLAPADNREYLVWDDLKTISWDKQVLAEEFLSAGGNDEKPLQLTTKAEWNPIIMFESTDGESLLSKEKLLKLKEIEDLIKAGSQWKQICLATSTQNTACSPAAIQSPTSFL